MRWRPKRGYRRVLVGAVLAVAALVLFLRSHVAWDGACTLARRGLPAALGMEVGIGRCELDPVTQTVRIFGLSAKPEGAEETLFAADRVEVSGLSVSPFGSVRIAALRLFRPRVSIELKGGQRPASGGGCPLSALKRVTLERLDLRDGEVRLRSEKAEEGPVLELTRLNVDWSSPRRVAAFKVDVGRGTVKLKGKGEPLSLATFSVAGDWAVADDRLDLRKVELGIEGMTLGLSGRIEELCAPRFALDGQLFLPMKLLGRATGQSPEKLDNVNGQLWTRLTLSGTAKRPALSMELVGQKLRWGDFEPGDLDADLHLADGELTLNGLRFNASHGPLAPHGPGAGPGKVLVSGSIRLDQPKLPARFKLKTEGAHLGKVLQRLSIRGAWVDFPTDLTAQVTGTLLPRPQLKGNAEFTVGAFTLANRPFDKPNTPGATTILTFDKGWGQTNIKVLPDRVELHEIKVGVGESRAQGEVDLLFRSALRVAVTGDLNLSDFKRLVEVPWAGKGTARVNIDGPFGGPKVDSSFNFDRFKFWFFDLGHVEGPLRYEASVLSFPDVKAQKGRTSYTGNAALTFGPQGLYVKGKADAPKGRAEDLVDLLLPLHPAIEVFQHVLTGEASAQVWIDSLAEKLTGEIRASLRDTRYYDRRLGDAEILLRLVNGDALQLARADFDGPAGKFHGEGQYRFEGPIEYRVSGSQISPGQWLGAPDRLEGALSLQGTVGGTDAFPKVRMKLTSPGVGMNGQSLGATRMDFALDGLDASFKGQPFEGTRLDSKLQLKAPYPYQADMKLDLPELGPFLPRGAVGQGLTGTLVGAAQVAGNLGPVGGHATLEAQASVDRLTLRRGDFSVTNLMPLALSYREELLSVDRFTLRGPNTELSAEAAVGSSRLDVKAQGSMDARLLESFIPGLENAAGRVELGVALRGARSAPLLVGSAELRDTRFSLRDQPITLRALSGKLEFSETRVLVQELSGLLNDGRLTLQGDVEVERFQPKTVDLGARMEDVVVRPLDDLPVRLSGDLLLHGPPSAMVLSGDLDILKLRYERPFALDEMVSAMARKAGSGGGGAEAPREWLSFDVKMHTRGEVRVDNNLANARLNGDLNLTGTNLHPGLVGRVETAPGSQAYFRLNQFRITQGVVEFRDRNRIDALFDVQAEAQVRDYNVSLHAFGRPSQPSILLTSNPQLSEADILSLLTVGVTSRDRSSTAGTGAAIATEAFLNASGLDRQMQRFVPKNSLLKSVSFHIASAYNDVTGTVEPTAQLESRVLTEQLKLGMSQPVSISGRGTRARAEYQFDSRFSAQAQWDNEHSDSPFGNLGLDFKLRWETQ